MTTDSAISVSMADYNKLSIGARLLLCYMLYYNIYEIQLMVRDTDYRELAKLGWIVEVQKPNVIHGVKNFEIPDEDPSVYDELQKIKGDVLMSCSITDLENYKESKRASYPWLW